MGKEAEEGKKKHIYRFQQTKETLGGDVEGDGTGGLTEPRTRGRLGLPAVNPNFNTLIVTHTHTRTLRLLCDSL